MQEVEFISYSIKSLWKTPFLGGILIYKLFDFLQLLPFFIKKLFGLTYVFLAFY